MSRNSGVPEALESYVQSIGHRDDDIARRLREETAALSDAGMQIGAIQAAFMANLVRLMGARRCIEVGTFTGYSALAVARALPADGIVLACDVSEEWTAIGQRYWFEAGVADRIDLRLAPALETLDALLSDGQAGQWDFAFIDADKVEYEAYYERCLALLRTGGCIAIDNVLWSGSVVDPEKSDPSTEAIRAFNTARASDERVHLSLVPIGDGLTPARQTVEAVVREGASATATTASTAPISPALTVSTWCAARA